MRFKDTIFDVDCSYIFSILAPSSSKEIWSNFNRVYHQVWNYW